MITTTKLLGAPICVDHLPPKGNNAKQRYPIQVTFNCGSYNDIIIFEYRNIVDQAHGFMMWQELIVTAKCYKADQ
jgi:hypothetical protein